MNIFHGTVIVLTDTKLVIYFVLFKTGVEVSKFGVRKRREFGLIMYSSDRPNNLALQHPFQRTRKDVTNVNPAFNFCNLHPAYAIVVNSTCSARLN